MSGVRREEGPFGVLSVIKSCDNVRLDMAATRLRQTLAASGTTLAGVTPKEAMEIAEIIFASYDHQDVACEA